MASGGSWLIDYPGNVVFQFTFDVARGNDTEWMFMKVDVVRSNDVETFPYISMA